MVPRKKFPGKVPKRFQKMFPGTGSQARVPRQGSQEVPSKAPRNRFLSKVPRKRFPSKGSQEEVSRNRFPSKVPRNRFCKHGFQEPLSRFPGTVSQAKQGSQNRFSSKCFQEQVSRKRCPSKVPSKFPKQDFQEHVFPSKTRFSEQVFKQVFPGRAGRGVLARFPASWFPSNVFRKRFPSKVPSHRFPGTGAHTRFPRTGSQVRFPSTFPNKAPRKRFPSKVPGNRFPGTRSQTSCPRTGSQVRFPEKVPRQCFQEKVPKQGSQEQLLQGSQEEVRKQGFPVAAGNFALEPALPGNACLRTCSCEPCSCLEACLETVPGTLFGNRFWEPYLQAVPKNLTLLGNLFLDTCLGASSWELAWECFSPTA